jgi:hypothetical protein
MRGNGKIFMRRLQENGTYPFRYFEKLLKIAQKMQELAGPFRIKCVRIPLEDVVGSGR